MKLEYLADKEDLLPTVAKWYFEKWGCLDEGNTLDKDMKKLQVYLNKDRIPLMLLATDANEALGVVQLKFHEMSIYPEKTHWLGGVYVAKEHRGRGIARQIILELILIAEKLNVKILHLQTEDLTGGLYREMGWRPIEQVNYHDVEVLVMERKLNEIF